MKQQIIMHKKTASGYDETGIAGVRRRMAALGGTVSIESAPGSGCGVSVHVPLDDAPPLPEPAPAAPHARSPKEPR